MVRFAEENELDRINELRRQVFKLHAEGKPDVFRTEFSDELRDYIYTVWKEPSQQIIVCERKGKICGFATVRNSDIAENPAHKKREFLEIDEICVDEACRRQGVATELIDFAKDYAKRKGFNKIELNMWEFNQSALKFYEHIGFSTYRRNMEMNI